MAVRTEIRRDSKETTFCKRYKTREIGESNNRQRPERWWRKEGDAYLLNIATVSLGMNWMKRKTLFPLIWWYSFNSATLYILIPFCGQSFNQVILLSITKVCVFLKPCENSFFCFVTCVVLLNVIYNRIIILSIVTILKAWERAEVT